MDFGFVGMFIRMIEDTVRNVILFVCALAPLLGLWHLYLRKRPPQWVAYIGIAWFAAVILLGLGGSLYIAVHGALQEDDLSTRGTGTNTRTVESPLW